MFLPTYLNIKEAAKRIQQKCRESVTPEWLLQHASEGRLQLFALLREDACILKPGIKIDPATLRTLSTLDKAMMSAKKIHEATTVAEKAGTYIHMSDQLARTMLVKKSVSSISVTFKGKQKPAVDRRFVYINEIDGSVRALPGFTIKMDDLRFLSEDIERLIDANQPAAATHPKVSPSNTANSAPESDTVIPGKMPRTSIGKLAIEAAWLIEQSKSRAATVVEVIAKLQTCADEGSRPEVLLKSEKGKRGVEWRTKNGKSKLYDVEACGKTLAAWIKSRA